MITKRDYSVNKKRALNCLEKLYSVFTDTDPDMAGYGPTLTGNLYDYLKDDTTIDKDKLEISINVGPYIFYLSPRFNLTDKQNPIKIITYERIVQMHRLEPHGKEQVKSLKDLTFDYTNEWSLHNFNGNTWFNIFQEYCNRLVKYVDEIEQEKKPYNISYE